MPMIPVDFARRLPDRPLDLEEIDVLAGALDAAEVHTAGSPTRAVLFQLRFEDGIEAYHLGPNGWRAERCLIDSCARPVERERSHPTRGPIRVCRGHSDEIDALGGES